MFLLNTPDNMIAVAVAIVVLLMVGVMVLLPSLAILSNARDALRHRAPRGTYRRRSKGKGES